MYINNANRLNGDIDLGQELDFSKYIEYSLPKDKNINIPDKVPIITEKVTNEEILEPISDCNNKVWKYGIVASCFALYFGLPLIFGNK